MGVRATGVAPFVTVFRLALVGLAVPCVYLGGAGAAFFFHHRSVNASAKLPTVAAALPAQTTRLLVFAPHCDDETLGCAGIIQQTIRAGGHVRAVMITNGDGFRTAVERQTRALRVGPADYIRFAALRQREAASALGNLGLGSSDVLFLGYPDRGLMPLWNSNWDQSEPYVSGYTHCTRSPYVTTLDPAATYCGHDLLADIERTIREFRPTQILVTHPGDDHPDHAAASAFVTRALAELAANPQDEAWARAVSLRYYLVHRGDWPLPQGDHPEDPLLPPAEMQGLDTRWSTLPLPAADTLRKQESVERYRSQTALMGRFLNSFARRNEIFGQVDRAPLTRVADGSIAIDAETKGWESLPAVLLDPLRDNVLRDLQGSGDIGAVYACRDTKRLYLRLDVRQPVSSRILYTMRVRPFAENGITPQKTLTLRVRAGELIEAPWRSRAVSGGSMIVAAVPLIDVMSSCRGRMPTSLSIAAETSVGGITIDTTGIRFLSL